MSPYVPEPAAGWEDPPERVVPRPELGMMQAPTWHLTPTFSL